MENFPGKWWKIGNGNGKVEEMEMKFPHRFGQQSSNSHLCGPSFPPTNKLDFPIVFTNLTPPFLVIKSELFFFF